MPAVVREHGDEPVQLPIEAQAPDDLGAVRLEPTVEVVQTQAGDPAGDPVEDLRENSAAERVAAVGLPAGDQVEALVELRQEPRYLGRVILEIGVDRDDDVAFGVRKSG